MYPGTNQYLLEVPAAVLGVLVRTHRRQRGGVLDQLVDVPSLRAAVPKMAAVTQSVMDKTPT